MIPLEYRLREPVRLEAAGNGVWRVICEEPLTVLTVNTPAVRLLKGTRYGATVTDIASGLGLSGERVLALCEYFRGRGILDVRRAPAGPSSRAGSGSNAGALPPRLSQSSSRPWAAPLTWTIVCGPFVRSTIPPIGRRSSSSTTVLPISRPWQSSPTSTAPGSL